MNVSVFSSEQLLKLLFTNAALGTRPTAWYVALHTGDPTLDGSANEVTATPYSRRVTTLVADQPVAGQVWRVRNDADLVFPAPNSAYTVTHVTVKTANSGGTCLAIFALPLARTVPIDGVFSIPINELVITGE
jgi:hypothetical protein